MNVITHIVIGSVLITRVVLKNYKSIASCSLRLRPLNFLVGPNGSGKSNFLDALRLVSESLNSSLDHALRERGGINEVRRRSSGHPTHFGMRLDFTLPGSASGHYAFSVGAKPKGGFEVQHEECRLYAGEALQDDKTISDESILAVSNRNGDTIIGPVDAAGRRAIRDNLSTAGELLRLSQLSPDSEAVAETPESQLELFGKRNG